MTRKDQKAMDPTQFMDTVVKNSTRFWEGMAGFAWPSQDAAKGTKADGASTSFNPWESWEPAMEAWKQLQESCSPDALADSLQSVREEGMKQFEKMAQSGWENLFSMGEGYVPSFPWAQPPFGLGVSELFGGKGTVKELFKLMSGEMNRFVTIPPVGLSRNYQEKVVHVVDKGNQFLLTLSEYIFLMFTPMEQAMQMVQATVTGLNEEQRRGLTAESVYETWLKELEQGYFALYGSEEYLGLLKRLVAAMGEFNLARQNFMSDCLKLMGIPSENDLDDLYRDLYSIKKKLSSLENAVDKMAQPPKAEKPAKKMETKETSEASAAPKAPKADEKAAKPKVAAKSAGKAEKTTKQTAKAAGKTP